MLCTPVISLLSRDCLLEFQVSFDEAETNYIEGTRDCITNETIHEQYCREEQDYMFSDAVGKATKAYDNCVSEQNP